MGIGVYWKAFKVSLQTKLEYRADFFLGVSAAIGLQAAGLGMMWVVLNKSGTLAGWSGRELALLYGLTTMIQGLSELLFNHVWYVPYYIVRGQIDRLLTYPVKSLPFFLLTSPELHSFGNLAGGLALFIFAGAGLGLPWWTWLLLPYWVLCGCLVHTSALVLCAALCFKIMGQKAQHFWVVNALLQATRYPLGVFPGPFQALLLFVLPFAAANFLPVGFLLKGFSVWGALAAPLAAAAVSVSAAFLSWNAGLKAYESTGS